MSFVIKQISAYNYSGDNSKINGTVEFVDGITKTEMKFQLTQEDAVRIFDVFADRISATVSQAAQVMLSDIKATGAKELSPPPARLLDDEIPF